MAASKRLPYRSYYYYYSYCCVSFIFGSVGIVLYSQRSICREYESHLDHIYLEFRSVRAGDVMNGHGSCEL